MTEIGWKTKHYQSDPTDEEWARIAPLLWDPARTQVGVEMREMLNAIRREMRARIS